MESPSRQALLALTGPHGVDTMSARARSLLRTGVPANAARPRLAEQDRFQGRHGRRRRNHREKHAGPVLLHLNRNGKDVERARREELIEAVSNDFRRQVIQVRLENDHRVRFGC